MNPNMGMANMNAMGGPVSGAPMPMMNNGAMNPQMAAAAAAAAAARQLDSQHGVLNTYIYEYFIRYGMYDCARSLLSSDQQVNVYKDGTKGGNAANGDDPMDTDGKDDLDGKLPDDLPPPKLPIPASDTSFLYEWFCLFWEIFTAQRGKTGSGTVNQYVAHTQNQQQELLRQMRPDLATQHQYQIMRMQNGNMNMNMNMKQNNLARAAMANNQNNPQMMLQQAKQNQMQRDPSGMDPNRDRPSSPASGENAPSPSKRPRIDGAPFHPNAPGGMVANGRPGPGMPGQMQPNPSMAAAAAHRLLNTHGIDPNGLSSQQLQQFINAPPAAQQKSIATYSQNLQQHHGTQMGNKQLPNVGGQQSQGSPMMAQGPDGTALSAYYNPDGQMAGPGGIRTGHVGAQAPAGSNHALQDYQMQLMLLEQQNKKRLLMARTEQESITGMPREGGGPGVHGQPGPNGHLPEASPQAMRSGASPNPSEQMKRGTPQMHNSGISSPVPPEGGQSRELPNPAMNFMGSQVDPNMAPHFFKSGVEGTMAAAAQAQMNGMRPPSSHPGQPFNGQMNPQQMMAARQMQQSQGQPVQQPGGQGAPGQWQQAPNGGQGPQGMSQNQQVQGTPQQRSMPPPSAPVVATNNVNNRTTASPQQPAAAPPTPSQSTKPAPKKKETKAAKEKRAAAAKKASQNANNNAGATPAGDNAGGDAETTPAAPATPVNAAFNKNAQNGGAGQSNASNNPTSATTAAASAPRTSSVPPQPHDPNQNGLMDSNFGMMEFPGIELANPLHSGDVLNDFDFDSFLHDGDGTNEPFDFNGTFPGMEGGEIGAD
ncbi:hypothetical protein E4U42_002878 [Claviceps africana]|uniref:LisH domain-containing protein n=1 Tax=Claviceps africana TaxID=83212 RepID=A0A8K0JIC2_9HYPO|nr:hypothetical protein E4U42_002878 [Claviceps africana]